MQLENQHKTFGGKTCFYSHTSQQTKTQMRLAVYLPPQAESSTVPALIWLSGLTCNEKNFITKAGAQRVAAELGLALVAPDTSPRGLDLPEEHDTYDFGSGAGFYVDATQEPWKQNYQMYSYTAEELPKLLGNNLPIDTGRLGICGHSMGGHGALVVGLRNPQIFRSISAFAPICNPCNSPWGKKAFKNYLGDDKQSWQMYDAVEILRHHPPHSKILIDQGEGDEFLTKQLKTVIIQSVARERNYDLEVRMQPGYDHSYYFISSFIDDHLRFHKTEIG